VRVHDVVSRDTEALVKLSHDIRNMSNGLPWEDNIAEHRSFYAISGLILYMKEHGFALHHEPMYQQGDPTRNGLVAFRKLHQA